MQKRLMYILVALTIVLGAIGYYFSPGAVSYSPGWDSNCNCLEIADRCDYLEYRFNQAVSSYAFKDHLSPVVQSRLRQLETNWKRCEEELTACLEDPFCQTGPTQ